MIIIKNPRTFFWVSVATGILVVGLSLYARAKWPTTTSVAPTLLPRVSSAQLTARYRTALAEASATLTPLLQHVVTFADAPVLQQVHDSLVSLAVPASAQGYHLQLVLVLTRLIGTVKGSANVRVAAATTMSLPQRQLIQLLAARPSLE